MSRRAHTVRLVGAFAAVYLIWGSTYLGMKVAVEAIPPIPMGGVRFTTAGALLLAILAVAGRVRGEWLRSLRYWRSALVTGALMLAAANGLLAYSLRVIPSGTSALVVAFTPVWLVLFDRLQTRRGVPPPRVLAGLGLGAVGVTVLIGLGSLAAAPPREEVMGIVVALLSTLCWALGSILGRHMALPRDILVGASMQMIAGGALMAIIALAFRPWMPVVWSEVSLRHWGAVAYLVAAGSMMGFTAYVWLLRNASAAKVSTYAYVNPLVAVLLGWLFLGEIPSTRVTIAAPLILAAVILLQWSPRRAQAEVVETAEPPEAPPDRRPAERAPELVGAAAPAEITPRSTSPPGDGR